ncbi:hypothetical protein NDU88_002636, partial [Pleurodeles waltl]
ADVCLARVFVNAPRPPSARSLLSCACALFLRCQTWLSLCLWADNTDDSWAPPVTLWTMTRLADYFVVVGFDPDKT